VSLCKGGVALIDGDFRILTTESFLQKDARPKAVWPSRQMTVESIRRPPAVHGLNAAARIVHTAVPSVKTAVMKAQAAPPIMHDAGRSRTDIRPPTTAEASRLI
jgi:hypothetical protein